MYLMFYSTVVASDKVEKCSSDMTNSLEREQVARFSRFL